MRLGVYFQHGPRPISWEKFPNLRAPTEWPLISVATPSYNSGEFLDRTMTCILSEDYPRLEYFVADGGSKDDSVKIIESHSAKLSGWLSEKDSGASHAINKGLGRSKGEIMTWLNADDLWMPGVLKYVAAYFAKHPEVDVVYGHRAVVDEKDNQVGRWILPRHDGEMIMWADYVPQETMFWRRSIWEKTGGKLDETFRFAFDWELLLRFQRAKARIVRLPYVMGMFRVHRAQMSTAQIDTLGLSEMKRLRDRELGAAFNEMELGRLVTNYQKRAVRCDRLLNRGLRW
jgi:glycosyltransferase involved in cell wall biosynthesis